jgi:hypothetical protein
MALAEARVSLRLARRASVSMPLMRVKSWPGSVFGVLDLGFR